MIDLAPGADPARAAPFLTERVVAVAVAIPTEVALLAVERSLRRALEARVPVIGLVENFASAMCGACGEEVALFREADPALRFASMGIEVIARIPFDPALARAADSGLPYVLGPGASAPAGRALAGLADRLLCYPAAPEVGHEGGRSVCALLALRSFAAGQTSPRLRDKAGAWGYDLHRT